MQLTIKQEPGDGRCAACVAAMAAGDESTDRFQAYVASTAAARAPYSDLHVYSYLLSRGFVVGLGFNEPDFGTIGLLEIKYTAKSHPAYVIVASRHGDMTHAVYWNGYMFQDPDKYTRDHSDFSKYKILLWVPIYKVT